MMQNPVTQERLDELEEESKEFFKIFGPLYTINYGRALYEKVKLELDEQNGTGPAKRKLTYREWDSVPRENVFTGYVFMQQGAGAGDFSDWKKYFFVERQDYKIDLYSDESKYQKGKKATITIQPAGYKVVLNVADHFRQEVRDVAAAIEMSDEETKALTADMSSASWALAHPQRPNYIFQMNKGTSSGCLCFKTSSVTPVDEGLSAEASAERQPTIDAMQNCITKTNPRVMTSIPGIAFERTCKEIPLKDEKLKDWVGEGTEPEILMDLLMEFCMPVVRDAILKDISGPTVFRLKLWYKCHRIIYVTLSKLMEVAWALLQKGIEKVHETIEPVLKKGIANFIELKTAVEAKIKAAVMDKIGGLLASNVTPFIAPMLRAFEQPLNDGFQSGRLLLAQTVKVSELPADPKQRNALLDRVPRDEQTRKTLVDPLSKLSVSLKELQGANELSAKLLAGLDVQQLQSDAETALLETMDAVICTLEQRLEKADAQDALLEAVLLDYDYDALIARSNYVKEVVKSVLIAAFKRLIAPVTDPIISKIDGAIPDPMDKCLNVEQIFDDIIHYLVGDPIDQMVEKAYPLPKAA